jgi:hypothetical protein
MQTPRLRSTSSLGEVPTLSFLDMRGLPSFDPTTSWRYFEMASRPSPIALTYLHNNTKRGVPQSINALLESGLHGEVVLDRLVEGIEPTVIFHPAVLPNGRLYRFIRDTLFAFGVTLFAFGVFLENKNHRPMIPTLATIYAEGELRDETKFLVNDCPGRRAASDTPVDQTQEFHRAIGFLLHMYKDTLS